MAELNITFAGTCVHLHDVVPGVPMRTVLPNALAIRFGVIKIPGADGQLQDAFYYLMPHYALARDRLIGGQGICLTGSYVTVLNAKRQRLCSDGGSFRLTQFVKNVELSPSVVFQGDAMAYVDVFGGRVRTDGKGDEARITQVSIKTEGTPIISITSLPGTPLPSPEQIIESHELHITNLDVEAATEDAPFDFLLNYLVARGGIPTVLSERTPGLPPEPKRLTFAHLGEKLKALGLLIETEGTVSGWRKSVAHGEEPGSLSRERRGSPIVATMDRALFAGTLASYAIDPVPFDQSCSPSAFP